LPQIGVLSELSYALGIGKSHTVRDLVSMAAAATERCRVWPKTAAQDVKCVCGRIVVVQDPVATPPFCGRFRRTDSSKRRKNST